MRLFGLLVLGFGLGVAGCGSSDDCVAGTKDCTCYSTATCRGELMCIDGLCKSGPPADGAVAPLVCEGDCNDDVGCTVDSCVEGVCAHMPQNDRCNDGESCDLRSGGCVKGATCGEDADCEDMESCTVDEHCKPSTRTCVYDMLDGDDDGVPPEVCGGTDPDDGDPKVLGGGEAVSEQPTDAG
jgi:hypothetical protein